MKFEMKKRILALALAGCLVEGGYQHDMVKGGNPAEKRD